MVYFTICLTKLYVRVLCERLYAKDSNCTQLLKVVLIMFNSVGALWKSNFSCERPSFSEIKGLYAR